MDGKKDKKMKKLDVRNSRQQFIVFFNILCEKMQVSIVNCNRHRKRIGLKMPPFVYRIPKLSKAISQEVFMV